MTNKHVTTKKQYEIVFQRRDEMCYHMDWARARGDEHQASRMQMELTGIDQVELVCVH